jgi:hypothetical protein
LFVSKLKNKKGFMLSDAFLGVLIATIIGITITSILFTISTSLKNQSENNEVFALASSLLEEIKSANTTIESATSNTTTISTITNGSIYKYTTNIKIEIDTFNTNFRVITVKFNWVNTKGASREYQLKGFKAVGI